MKIKDFSYLNIVGLADQYLEIRYDYGAGTVPIYIGYNHTPNADPNSLTWFIVKLTYTGANMTYKQLPNFGTTFSGSWTNRTTYFP